MNSVLTFISFALVAAVLYVAAPTKSSHSNLSTVSPSAKHTETAAAFKAIF